MNNILSNFISVMTPQLLIFAAIYVLVFLLISLDLWSGIRKAKQRQEYISSYGLRKTLDKIARYYNILIAISVIDLIQMLAIFELRLHGTTSIPMLPVLTFLAALFMGAIEVKSMYEKSEEKDKAKVADVARFIREAMKDKDSIEIIKNTLDQISTKDNAAVQN